LRAALDEIRVFRESYVEAFNKKDSTAVAAVYAPDAIMITLTAASCSGEMLSMLAATL